MAAVMGISLRFQSVKSRLEMYAVAQSGIWSGANRTLPAKAAARKWASTSSTVHGGGKGGLFVSVSDSVLVRICCASAKHVLLIFCNSLPVADFSILLSVCLSCDVHVLCICASGAGYLLFLLRTCCRKLVTSRYSFPSTEYRTTSRAASQDLRQR